MMDSELYNKLVDLYAAGELPSELEDEMKVAAFTNKELSHDMATLRSTVEMMKALPQPAFTEESFQRILMKLYARGIDIQPKVSAPSHMQFYLPIAG